MANSSAVAGLLAGVVAPERLTVVLNGTTGLGATVEPADDYLPGEPLVLTVGYLIERKGLRELVAAIGRLRARRPPRPPRGSSATARCATPSPRRPRPMVSPTPSTSSAACRTRACWR